MSVFHEMFLVLLWIGAIICIAVIYPQGERGIKIAWATGGIVLFGILMAAGS